MFVDQRQFGAAVKRLKQKRHQRLSFWHSRPFPSKNKLLLRNHFLINPGGIVLLAVQQPEYDAKATPRSHVRLGAERRPRIRTHHCIISLGRVIAA